MATQLDEKIRQLEDVVEKWLDRYAVTQSGIPATLPPERLEFPIEFLLRLARLEQERTCAPQRVQLSLERQP